ncbi:hypothetical protein MMC08_006446 [Hypocenomyce scalaris]|nr:hypothetical protein [Hypocenomyce scalaris]
MATFAKPTFSATSYAAFRPSYPASLYSHVLAYHRGPKTLLLDLGCGHGLISRYLAEYFSKVMGTDPSTGMLGQAQSSTPKTEYPNVEFREATAEVLPFLSDTSVDMVVAGQAAHWFDYPKLFPEMKRVVRKGGTLAFWGYSDPVFVEFPKATRILEHYMYGNEDRLLGPHWEPGRAIVRNKLRDIKPPTSDWTTIKRIEYEPGTNGPRTGEGTMFMNRRLTLGDCQNYMRTFSSVHTWQEKHPKRRKREEGGDGDIVDEMFDEMRQAEPGWQVEERWEEKEVELEFGSALLLARKL